MDELQTTSNRLAWAEASLASYKLSLPVMLTGLDTDFENSAPFRPAFMLCSAVIGVRWSSLPGQR